MHVYISQAHSLKEGKEDEEEEDEVMEKKEGIEKKLDNHASFCLEILNDDSGHYTEVDLASGKGMLPSAWLNDSCDEYDYVLI